MKIELRGQRRILSPELREFTNRKAQFTLGRFSPSIQELEIHIQDENGPKGGEDKTCKVLVKHGHGAPLVVSVTEKDAFSAVSEALERAGRSFRRRHDRIHDDKRRSLPLYGWNNIEKLDQGD